MGRPRPACQHAGEHDSEESAALCRTRYGGGFRPALVPLDWKQWSDRVMKSLVFLCGLTAAGIVAAQTPSAAPATASDSLKQRDQTAAPGQYQVDAGTHILLNVVKSVSTKHSQVGDRIYLETAFPVTSGNRIVIPQGS